jgi:peptide deformylase
VTSEWSVRLRVEQAGALVLHEPARPLTPAELQSATVQQVIDAMFATLRGTGVGLAAPQVGLGVQLVVIEDRAEAHASVDPRMLRAQERRPVEAHVLVNPRLELLDPTDVAEFFEGCLSVDGYRAIVPRARRVRVRALDRQGRPFEREATGWYARILQHELDHLAGRLYLTRMRPRTLVSAASYAARWSATPMDEALRLLDSPG